MAEHDLIQLARNARQNAYVPYSAYPVGAALEVPTADRVFTGCNIENANYSNALHAEEVAISRAIVAGFREFSRIAVSSRARDGVTPCGMCRQTLAEFCDAEFRVLCDTEDGVVEYTLGELIPNTISLETLENAHDRSGER